MLFCNYFLGIQLGKVKRSSSDRQEWELWIIIFAVDVAMTFYFKEHSKLCKRTVLGHDKKILCLAAAFIINTPR